MEERRARNCALFCCTSLDLRFCLHVLGFLGVSLSLQLSILHLSEVSYLYHLFLLWSHLLDTILISSCMVTKVRFDSAHSLLAFET